MIPFPIIAEGIFEEAINLGFIAEIDEELNEEEDSYTDSRITQENEEEDL